MFVHFLQNTSTPDWCDVARVTIDILPDIALLQIFDFYLDRHGSAIGTRWCMCAKDGESLFLGHLVA